MFFGVAMTVTRERTERDAFGDPVTTTAATIAGCAVLRHSTSEERNGREQVTETATLAAPAGADVTATDAVVTPDGARWYVAGRPHVPHSPFSGWEPGLVLPLERVTG